MKITDIRTFLYTVPEADRRFGPHSVRAGGHGRGHFRLG